MRGKLQICLALCDVASSESYAQRLRACGHNPWPTYNAPSTLLRLGHVLFDVLIADLQCSRIDETSILPFVRRVYPAMRVIAIEHETGGAWLADELADTDAVASCHTSMQRVMDKFSREFAA